MKSAVSEVQLGHWWGDYSKGAINGPLMSFSGLHIPALGSSKTLDGCLAGAGAGAGAAVVLARVVKRSSLLAASMMCWNAHQETFSVVTACCACVSQMLLHAIMWFGSQISRKTQTSSIPGGKTCPIVSDL